MNEEEENPNWLQRKKERSLALLVQPSFWFPLTQLNSAQPSDKDWWWYEKEIKRKAIPAYLNAGSIRLDVELRGKRTNKRTGELKVGKTPCLFACLLYRSLRRSVIENLFCSRSTRSVPLGSFVSISPFLSHLLNSSLVRVLDWVSNFWFGHMLKLKHSASIIKHTLEPAWRIVVRVDQN